MGAKTANTYSDPCNLFTTKMDGEVGEMYKFARAKLS